MSHKLLKGKKGIIFGALDSNSIAWKVAEEAVANGAEIILTNAPIALRMGSINELAINLTCLLSDRNTVGLLPNIADDFQSFVDLNKGVERAEITTAVNLSDSQKKDLSDKLKGIVGKDISIETHIDESIIGGFVARVGDLLVDGSIKTKLSNMERELIKGA